MIKLTIELIANNNTYILTDRNNYCKTTDDIFELFDWLDDLGLSNDKDYKYEKLSQTVVRYVF